MRGKGGMGNGKGARGKQGKMIPNGKAPIIHDNLSQLFAPLIRTPQQVSACILASFFLLASTRVFAGWLRHFLHYDCSVVAPLTVFVHNRPCASIVCAVHLSPSEPPILSNIPAIFSFLARWLSHFEAQVNA